MNQCSQQLGGEKNKGLQATVLNSIKLLNAHYSNLATNANTTVGNTTATDSNMTTLMSSNNLANQGTANHYNTLKDGSANPINN
jgi:hypothetical protein